MNITKTAALISIRFAFLFWVLFVYCFNGAFPFLYYIQQFTTPVLHKFIPWVAAQFLNVSGPVSTTINGSGDTTYHYVLLLCIFICSVVGTLIWSALDYKRKSYDQLFYWLITVLRFYVGLMLVSYGLAKLNDGQFPALGSYRLFSTYGDSSPMGLAWSFLSYSKGYKWFMCLAELMGFLLFFRRTATIGAFLCLMTTANIVAINYCFDVPVKILSTGLMLMCLTILSPNIIQMFRFFFKGETVGLNFLKAPVFKTRWMRISKLVVKYAIILLYAVLPLFIALKLEWFGAKSTQHHAMNGIFDIEDVTWADQKQADSADLQPKWTQLTFEERNYGLANAANGRKAWYKYKLDTLTKSVQISFTDDPNVSHTLNYTLADHDRIVLKGDFFGKPATLILKKKSFELTERGFRWINEVPYNR
ncbi:putative membrane protein YphA (DoxX/SURF4 family) [Pedobacter africanus]|uniref:Membrane protein YphA (DoxX/SURF4 family) n=1 Tax=Pedobacter africanus TaxID=151894 RepID=A0ACC6KRS7_9SPHI|nr:hypothetical protein [Pedobacter africanus]MDR6781860.1 putative membrane protein YphA (DoxX/SURF4 family) [Pedobacter africanus]